MRSVVDTIERRVVLAKSSARNVYDDKIQQIKPLLANELILGFLQINDSTVYKVVVSSFA